MVGAMVGARVGARAGVGVGARDRDRPLTAPRLSHAWRVAPLLLLLLLLTAPRCIGVITRQRTAAVTRIERGTPRC